MGTAGKSRQQAVGGPQRFAVEFHLGVFNPFHMVSHQLEPTQMGADHRLSSSLAEALNHRLGEDPAFVGIGPAAHFIHQTEVSRLGMLHHRDEAAQVA